MKKRILTEDDLRDIENSIENVDINQFDTINKGQYNFNSLRDPGIFRLWHSSTSPSKTTADYLVVVYKYGNNVVQVAHSSTNNTSTRNKVYVRSYYNSTWTDWRELTNTEIEKEVDSLKQSGVESNKILVDALNSKKVYASTNDSIKTNVKKVNNIKMGDYGAGDTVSKNNIRARYKKPIILPIMDRELRAADISNDGWLLYAPSYSTIYVYDNKRDRRATISANRVDGAFFDDDNNIIVFDGGDEQIRKHSNTGAKRWEVNIDHVLTNSQFKIHKNNIYINSTLGGFYKITSNGSKSRVTSSRVNHFDVKDNGEITTVSETKVQVRTSSGSVKRERDLGTSGAIIYDNTLNEYTFWGRDNKIYRLDSNLNTKNTKPAPDTLRIELTTKNQQDEIVSFNFGGDHVIQFDSNNNIQFELEFDPGTTQLLDTIKPGPNNSFILTYNDRVVLILPGDVHEYEIVKGV